MASIFMPEDTVVVSRKSDFDPSRNDRVNSVTDGQTGGFSALYSRLASLPALSCRCMGVAKQINLKPSFA